MENRFIMTAFGEDRPGIVADVTRILFDNGCNLEETSMTQLADEFTLILLFSADRPEMTELLERECRRLEKEKGISAFVRPLRNRSGRTTVARAGSVLHVEGVDQAGIVYKVSQFLADKGLNICDLKSQVSPSPGSGTILYIMDIHVQLPEGTDLSTFEQGLAVVADDLNVDISFSA
ncbi:glycine cleavage system protein R [Geothermobacter hydrogeniphilus]|uniref:ACT domain-containing protein n=1 Tax=Geothermobacter hydrogeniphilus TaxID=1969733 RepID=A0A1X0YE98_9BACT|nr:ACT domain-containing protein [Geothermobacter hydrogeniphilus]ORJ63466.1 hypothetical protein B5V00_00965 [Geothermobacter hydrogeniphilus]